MTAAPVQRLYTAGPAHHTDLVKAFTTLLLTAALTLGAASHAASPEPEDLPDIGSPAQAMLSLEEEYQIGRMIVRGLRDQDQILEDPEVSEYIRSIGARLSSQANDGSQRFNFFVIRDNAHQRVRVARRLHRRQQRAAARHEERERARGRDRARNRARHSATHRAQHRGAEQIEPGVDGGDARGDPHRRRPAAVTRRWRAWRRRRASRSSNRSASRAPTKPKPTASASASSRAPASIRRACRRSSRP